MGLQVVQCHNLDMDNNICQLSHSGQQQLDNFININTKMI